MICRFVVIQLSMFRLESKAVYSLEWKDFVRYRAQWYALSEQKVLICLLSVIVWTF